MDKNELARRKRAERLRKRIRERVETPRLGPGPQTTNLEPTQGERTPTTPRELADEEAEKARREKDVLRPP
jgi:hypothetical protein